MDQRLKQRLVGVMVLLALAIIFLPSLFHRDQRVTVDTTTLIPPKPRVAPVIIEPAVSNIEVEPAPSPEKAFQPPVLDDDASLVSKSESKANVEAAPKPSLNAKGLPNTWVVQVGSFQSQKRADELKEKLFGKKYKAYTRAVNTSKGKFFRVFVGPYVDKGRARAAKTAVDKQYKVNSQVLKFAAE